MSSQNHILQSNKQKPYELLSMVKNLFNFENASTEITLSMIPVPFQNVQTIV